jgi:hypothetical protein
LTLLSSELHLATRMTKQVFRPPFLGLVTIQSMLLVHMCHEMSLVCCLWFSEFLGADLMIDPVKIAQMYPVPDLDSTTMQRLQESEPFTYIPDDENENDDAEVRIISHNHDISPTIEL